jgi:hypothetical protein
VEDVRTESVQGSQSPGLTLKARAPRPSRGLFWDASSSKHRVTVLEDSPASFPPALFCGGVTLPAGCEVADPWGKFSNPARAE